jgi:hypothetical protein
LRLADLGYFALTVLQTLAQQQAYWLTRLMAGTQVYAPQGQALATCLPAPGTTVVDRPVRSGVPQRLPARLSAVRVPQEVADQRRREWHADARRRGQAVSQARWRLADWPLFCPPVPAELLSGAAGLVGARIRWQSELVVKLWKSAGHLAHSRSEQPWRVLCEV